jgi:hypothetical protein
MKSAYEPDYENELAPSASLDLAPAHSHSTTLSDANWSQAPLILHGDSGFGRHGRCRSGCEVRRPVRLDRSETDHIVVSIDFDQLRKLRSDPGCFG